MTLRAFFKSKVQRPLSQAITPDVVRRSQLLSNATDTLEDFPKICTSYTSAYIPHLLMLTAQVKLNIEQLQNKLVCLLNIFFLHNFSFPHFLG